MPAMIVPRYFGSIEELDSIHVSGDPVIIPLEDDLIMIYDIVEEENGCGKVLRLVGIDEIDKSHPIVYRKTFVDCENRRVKVPRMGEEMEVEELVNVRRIDGKPIIVPIPSDKKYRFAIFELVGEEEEEDDVEVGAVIVP